MKKTPEETKKGLECCSNGDCDSCPYQERKLDCGDILNADALARIEQLENQIRDISKKVEAQSGTDMNVPTITGETSDGYHTFNELYHHRAVLFSVIVKAFPDKAWKSRLHSDGSMFDGMFIVGIDTPDGPATYHYDIEPYWDMFRCIELERAPEWDGHTAEQAINRIMKLEPVRHGRWIQSKTVPSYHSCSYCKRAHNMPKSCGVYVLPFYCPNCGAKMDLDEQETEG